MQIEGFVNARHVLTAFLAHEYAFSYYVRDKEIRVGHHKGTWFIAKMKDGKLYDQFSWGDGYSGVESPNEFTKSFVNSIRTLPQREDDSHSRFPEALSIMKALEIWGGPSEEVTKVCAVQPGRNAYIDEVTGDFVLNPETHRLT